jgi:hypothetical protein
MSFMPMGKGMREYGKELLRKSRKKDKEAKRKEILNRLSRIEKILNIKRRQA